jgi:uncharacterized protein
MEMDKDEVVRLTEEYGGEWGINHTRRILHLVSLIGEGEEYDTEVVWLAAHLHDWGGYSKWVKPGADHAVRSAEVAEGFLRERGCTDAKIDLILECIRSHHTGDLSRSLEAVLLSDADGLDFLGIVGVLRDFSKAPRDLRGGYDSAKKRREHVPQLLCLDKSKELAATRLAEMDELLAGFEWSTFGYF